jgi:hypothetical protein
VAYIFDNRTSHIFIYTYTLNLNWGYVAKLPVLRSFLVLQQEKMIHPRGGLDSKLDAERVVLAPFLSSQLHGKSNKTYRREVHQYCTDAELVEIFCCRFCG